MKVTSIEFRQDVGHYQDAAQREPVIVTMNGRAHTVLISAALFEVMTRRRVVRMVEDLDDATLGAVAGSAVPEEFAILDKLLDDWRS